MYLVIFCYWVGPVPYLELFGAGPVEKNTLYISLFNDRKEKYAVLCPALKTHPDTVQDNPYKELFHKKRRLQVGGK